MKTIMTIVALIVATSAQAQGIFWDNEEGSQDYMIALDTVSLSSEELKGNVRRVNMQMYKAVIIGGKVQAGELWPGFFQYVDEDSPELPVTEYSYEYDRKGRMTRQLRMKYLTTYTYNSGGQLVERRLQNTDENIDAEYRPLQKTVFSYENNAVASCTFYSNNQLTGREVYLYDSRGNLISITTFDENFTPLNTATARFEYDTLGRLIYKEFSEPGPEPRTVSYTYYSNGEIKTETITHQDGESYTNEYEKGFQERPIYMTGNPKYVDGKVVEWKSDDNSDVCTYKYIYDRRGNWTELIEYKNGQPTVMLKRDIEYYD